MQLVLVDERGEGMVDLLQKGGEGSLDDDLCRPVASFGGVAAARQQGVHHRLYARLLRSRVAGRDEPLPGPKLGAAGSPVAVVGGRLIAQQR